jgi:hypothetical protein
MLGAKVAAVGLAALLSVEAPAQFTVLHSFNGQDGGAPKGSMIFARGTLYGFTAQGGNADTSLGLGTLFVMKPNGTGFNSYYTFTDPSGDQPQHGYMELTGNKLYRTNRLGADGGGELFSVKLDGTGYTPLHVFAQATGWQPYSGVLIGPSRLLYGLTAKGGDFDGGVLYSYNLGNGDYKVLYSFGGNATGFDPRGELIFDSTGRYLLGMTREGGTNGDGTIFRISPYGSNPAGTYTDLYALNNADPTAAGFQDHGILTRVGRMVFGLTQLGGANGEGTLFAMGDTGSNFSLIHSFGDPGTTDDGQDPYGSLAYVHGIFYGMTRDGGVNGLGSIFYYNLSTGAYRMIFSFDESVGAKPVDNLTSNAGGNVLYGMTQEGGAFDPTGALKYGTVFSIVLRPARTPPTITLQPVSLTVFTGRNATFMVAASGGRPLRYQWQKDGVDIPGAVRNQYTIRRVNSTNDGVYRVIVTNPVTAVPSANVTLTVN